MTELEVDVATQAENHGPQVQVHEAASVADTGPLVGAAASGIRPPAVPASLSAIPRLFKGSGLRKPSKIPRFSKQQSSVASTMDHTSDVQASKTSIAACSAVSVASGVSSRETTPFSSPSRPSSRLREPKHVFGRKRSREEMTSSTFASVAERLMLQERHQMQHSEELTMSSQTTLDDATSMGSVREEDCEPVEDEEQRREQELTVARALQRDLLRDRARLRLRINSLKEDVEVYYELLARMEQAVVAIRDRREGDGKSQSLSERILAIISAKRDEQIAEDKPLPAETSETGLEQESTLVVSAITSEHNQEVCGGVEEDDVEEH